MTTAERLASALRREAEEIRLQVERAESDGVVDVLGREDLAVVHARIDNLEAS